MKIENKLKNNLKEPSRVTLTQNIIFRSNISKITKVEKKSVETIECPHLIGPKDQHTWHGLIKIPPITASINPSVSSCNIIEISYCLDLHIDSSITTYDLKDMSIPVTIGTVPINDGSSNSKPLAVSYEVDALHEGIESEEEEEEKMTEEKIEENTEENKKVEMIDSNKKTFVPLYAKYMFDNSKFIDLSPNEVVLHL